MHPAQPLPAKLVLTMNAPPSSYGVLLYPLPTGVLDLAHLPLLRQHCLARRLVLLGLQWLGNKNECGPSACGNGSPPRLAGEVAGNFKNH